MAGVARQLEDREEPEDMEHGIVVGECEREDNGDDRDEIDYHVNACGITQAIFYPSGECGIIRTRPEPEDILNSKNGKTYRNNRKELGAERLREIRYRGDDDRNCVGQNKDGKEILHQPCRPFLVGVCVEDRIDTAFCPVIAGGFNNFLCLLRWILCHHCTVQTAYFVWSHI